MNLKKTSISPLTEILPLIEEARNAELCRDIELMQSVVKAFWEDFDRAPNLSGYEKPIQAELLRISGAFLSFYGYARNKRDYQIRGKDLLTQAIELFESEKLTDKAAEAKVMLAHCYWNTGEIEESEALLKMVEADFGENLKHPVYLKICINRLLTLIWKKEFDQALEIIEKIDSAIAVCGDLRLQAQFHIEAGIFYRSTEKYERAVFHYQEAICAAKKCGNQTFVTLNLNNLAFLHKETKDYEEAVRCADLAIETAIRINNRGWLPHFLDTKALIYLDTKQFDTALDVINQAIKIFREGEDAAGLTDALWTQVRCLLRLGRKQQALLVFNDLLDISRTRIGETAVQKFSRAFSEEIYILQGLSLTEEVQQFKKEQVRAALLQAKGKISEAARLLGLNSHQALSDILNNQFPGLYQESGFRRRASRKVKKRDGDKSRTVFLPSENILSEAKISQLMLPDKSFTFAFPCSASEFKTFYFDRFLMKRFGIESGAVVAVTAVEKLKVGMLLLILNEDDFMLARAEHDSWANVFYITDERGEPLPLDTEQIVGEPVGYCLIEETDSKFIEFSRLPL